MKQVFGKLGRFAQGLNRFSSRKPWDGSGKHYSTVENLMIAGVTAGENLCTHPFRWNPETGKMGFATKKRDFFFWYLNIVLTLAVFSVPIFRTIEEMAGWREFSIQEVFLLRFAVIVLTGSIGLNMNAYVYGADVPFFINNGVRFFERFTETTGIDSLSGNSRASVVKLTELFMMALYYGLPLLAIPFIIISILKPTLPVFPSSLVKDPMEVRNWPLYALSVFAISGTVFNYVTCANFFLMAGVSIIMPSLDALDKLRTLDGIPTEIKLKLYSHLVLIGQSYNRIYASLLLPMAEGLLVMLSIYGLVSLITSEGVIRIALVSVGIAAYGILVVIFRMLAEVASRSELLLFQWKRKDVVHPRVLRHLRPVRIVIGSYFFVDIGIVLTLTDLIVNNAAGILLAQNIA